MANTRRQWQAAIRYKVEEDTEQMALVHGASLVALKAEALTWFREQQPKSFQRGDFVYFYSDGKTYPLLRFKPDADAPSFLEEGWFLDEYNLHTPLNSQRFPNFEAATADFVEKHLIPEPGPEFQDALAPDGAFQLHLVRTIHRVANEKVANTFLQRGWRLLALDAHAEMDYFGKDIAHRSTVYVLGHPEEQALYYSLDEKKR
jgi:hypothetical protein